ncbi:hypothetical protein ACGFX4_18935 [Kitasatospora sp. NPDC048365]|uniref:hypothetical protein n=1 Tax=Kitasatospora sp. NPDC048365 TaxID=3364050 RepID=UPI00371D32DF
MHLTELAQALDGRPVVVLRPYLFGDGCSGSDAEVRWVCWLYGYRSASFRRSRFGTELMAVLDPDPLARPRGDWMRSPVLLRGLDTPVPWTHRDPDHGAPLWTPPGWPPGHGPVRPAPERMPQPSPEEIRDRHQPAMLLVLAALFAVLAIACADTRPAGAVVLALFALGSLVAHLPARRHRDRLLSKAAHRPPMYDPPTGGAR